MQAARPLTKPGKQRKMLFQAPAHVRHRLFSAHLSPELRAQHGIKTFPVRTGDTVRVLRGDHKGVEGKITRVDLAKYRIYVEGVTREKADGTTVSTPIHPSKATVTRLNLDDKWRKEILEIRKEGRKKIEKAEEPTRKPERKPAEKLVEVEEVKEEELKEVVVEKPAVIERAPGKRVAEAKRKPARKKAAKRTKPDVKEAEKEKKVKPKPGKSTKHTARRTRKETEEGEE